MEAGALRRGLALASSTALAASLAATPGPVTAQTCTDYVDGTWTSDVPSGMVLCGGDGDDLVTGDVTGVFIGNGGNDTVVHVRRDGLFDGGDGDDWVMREVSADDGDATFIGGAGNDRAHRLNGHRGDALFDGGAGDDSVEEYIAGSSTAGGTATFLGGPGNDVVGGYVYGSGTFDGGEGDDSALSWVLGTFLGGDGADRATLVVGTRFDGGDGDDVVLALRNGMFDGGGGIDTLDTCSSPCICVNVENAPANCAPSDTDGGSVSELAIEPAIRLPVAEQHECTDYVDGAWPYDVGSGQVLCGSDGDDLVVGDVSGIFVGNGGDDRVAHVRGSGRFDGGAGDDTLARLSDGVFDGGGGIDTLDTCAGSPTWVSVENAPPNCAPLDTDRGAPADSNAGTASPPAPDRDPVPPAGSCTIDLSQRPGYRADGRNVFDGDVPKDMVLCGGPGMDVVTGSVAGIFRGRGGDDRVKEAVGPHNPGDPNAGPALFDGGPGNDVAHSVHRGTFEGGDGDDAVGEDVGYGIFRGGPGNDRVKRDVGKGVFYGGSGNDLVWRVEKGGAFHGGTGADFLGVLQKGGAFDGGAGRDTLKHLEGAGTCISVEVGCR